jgi:hypothetical protein
MPTTKVKQNEFEDNDRCTETDDNDDPVLDACIRYILSYRNVRQVRLFTNDNLNKVYLIVDWIIGSFQKKKKFI